MVSSESCVLQESGRNASQDRSVTTVPVVRAQAVSPIANRTSSPTRPRHPREKGTAMDLADEGAKPRGLEVLQKRPQHTKDKAQRFESAEIDTLHASRHSIND